MIAQTAPVARNNLLINEAESASGTDAALRP